MTRTLDHPAPVMPDVPRAAGEPDARDAQVGFWALAALISAQFGAALAFLVPMTFTLAFRVDQLAPENHAALGYIIGAGAIGTLLSGPLVGILSDRTRSRWGRRRPFAVIGVLVGLGSVPCMAFAPDLLWLGAGWVIASLGWGTVLGAIGNYQADRLPANKRGKVAGLAGMTTQLAPVSGILLAGLVTHDSLLVFLLPVLVGLPLVALFVLFADDRDSREATFDRRLTLTVVLGSYVFNPRRYPDYSWLLVGRAVFFVGLSLVLSYATFFYAARLGIPVSDIAPTLAVISLFTIATSVIGSVLGGGLSDRIGRRRPFVLAAAVLYAGGALILANAHSFGFVLGGALISSFGIAVFLAANQALLLDVLPNRATEAGRYMAIASYSQSLPMALGPLLAPAVLAIGATSGPNFTALYVTVAAIALVSGATTSVGVRGAR